MGATVTAIDAARESVGVGAAHAARDPLVASRTRFIHTTAEQLVAEGTIPIRVHMNPVLGGAGLHLSPP